MPHFKFHPALLAHTVKWALVLAGMPALQSVNAHEYTALIDAKKYAEVATAISHKLAIEPNNADALVAKVDLMLLVSDVSHFDEGVNIAEQCIAHNPKNSECHEALGNVLGVKAERGGMMEAVGSLGTIREAFEMAIALDPNNYTASASLLTFYLEVPGFMGGSTASAKKLIRNTEQSNPDAAKLLQVKFDLHDENFEKAQSDALAVKVDHQPVLAKLQSEILVELGFTLIREKQWQAAENTLQATVQMYPDSAPAYLGLGRLLLEQGKAKEALIPLEKSLSINATAAVWYRLGKTWQALGESSKAKSSFTQALAFTPALTEKARDDAQQQLKVL
jgi:tetratricopeptide (TPR) repeat protein